MNLQGEKFLDKLYKDLYLSDEVKHTSTSKDSKEQSIRKYLDRIEKVHSIADNEQKKEFLKNLYYEKYVIKKENISNNVNEQDKANIINGQKISLSRWIDYLMDENTSYPMWARYWAFKSVTKMGSYNGTTGSYNSRTDKTLNSFVDANPEIISYCMNSIIKSVGKEEISDEEVKKIVATGSFSKLYTLFEHRLVKENTELLDTTDGEWIKYNQGSINDAKKLSKSLENKNTHWCTADVDTAIKQVCGPYCEASNGGDFYVYYTKNKKNEYSVPRIAIRMINKNQIGEIRGIEDNQNLEEIMEPIIEKKLKEMSFVNEKDIDKYMTIISDLRELSSICKKEELNNKDKMNLYTKKYGFGWENDPRAEKIKENRNFIKDIESFDNLDDKEMICARNYSYLVSSKDIKSFKDEELILRLSNRLGYGGLLEYLDDELKNKKVFVSKILERDPYNLKYVSDKIRDDKEIVKMCIEKSDLTFEYASDRLKDDEEIVTQAVSKNGNLLEYASDRLKDNKVIAKIAVSNCRDSFIHVSKNLKNDREIVLETIRKSKDYYNFTKIMEVLSDELKDDKEIMKNAVETDGLSLRYASDRLKDDEEVVLNAIKCTGASLKYASKRLRANKEIVLTAIKMNDNFSRLRDSMIFSCISDELKDDEEVVIEASKNHCMVCEDVSERLKNDKEFIKNNIKNGSSELLKYSNSQIRNDENFALELISINPISIIYMDDKFKNNKELVLNILKRKGNIYFDLSDELKSDKDIFLEAIKDAHTLKFIIYDHLIPDKYIDDKEIMLEIIKSNPGYIEYLDEKIKNNKDIALSAIIEHQNRMIDEKSTSKEKILNDSLFKFINKDLINEEDITDQIIDSIEKERRKRLFEFLDDTKEELVNMKKIPYANEEDYIPYKNLDPELRDDEEFISKVVKSTEYGMMMASDRLKNDEKFILQNVKINPMVIRFIPENLRDNEQIVLETLKRNYCCMTYISDRLKNSLKFRFKARLSNMFYKEDKELNKQR